MPKLLVIDACLVNYHDDRGGVHEAQGNFIELPKADSLDLARAGRTLYVNRDDDPTKAKEFTATKDMIKAAEAMAKSQA